MNTFVNELNNVSTMKHTENGAIAYNSTLNKVYDLFAFGGAYRSRNINDKIILFEDAFDENPEMAIKCLFYLRDIRGGQGERQFFRDCFGYALKNKLSKETAEHLIDMIPEYGRWDDVIYFYNRINDSIDNIIINVIKKQLEMDLDTSYPSLLAKWMPSENASNSETKSMAKKLIKALDITPKWYRKTLSFLRKRINVLERLMSENRWDEIEFDKIPSKAGYTYRKAFSEREETKDRYREFMSSDRTKVNSSTLYPYEIISPMFGVYGVKTSLVGISSVELDTMQKYWENLPNYFNGGINSAICVVDVSGSMECDNNRPLKTSISLGLYCAERLNGPFKDMFITFSKNPKVCRVSRGRLAEKIIKMSTSDWGMNTDLIAVFNLLLAIATSKDVKKEDIPNAIIIISDMEIDRAAVSGNTLKSDMENMRLKWESFGINMPHLIYWNVNARNNTILDRGKNVTCVSGLSPVLFESVLSGKTGIDVMLEKLNSERYASILILN